MILFVVTLPFVALLPRCLRYVVVTFTFVDFVVVVVVVTVCLLVVVIVVTPLLRYCVRLR